MVSVIILSKNEEKNIQKCLKSVEWADEILIIDDYSTDNTMLEIHALENKKIHIYHRYLHNDFASQRNFGIEKSKNEWLLFIDADEIVSPSLQYEITSVITNSIEGSYGYYVKRKDIMWGRELQYGESGTVKLLRLAKKGFGKWEGKVHERWVIKEKTAELKNVLHHYPHQTISDFIEEINFYTDIRAKELYQKQKRLSGYEVLCYPVAKFFINYIAKLGFLDGVPGLLSAILMSMHSFLVRGKLWQLHQRKKL